MRRRLFTSLLGCLALVSQMAGAQSIDMIAPNDPASTKISTVVDRGITHTRQLPYNLQKTRKAMVEKRAISNSDLKVLAELGDTLAALKYTKTLLAMGMTGREEDVAYYASIAAGGGRVSVFDEMVQAMYLLRPGSVPKSRLRRMIRVLYGHAWAGNTLALDAVIDLNGRDKLFGAMSDATRFKLLETGRDVGNGRIELKLAMKLLSDSDRGPASDKVAEGYLLRAERMGNLAVRTTAANLRRHIANGSAIRTRY